MWQLYIFLSGGNIFGVDVWRGSRNNEIISWTCFAHEHEIREGSVTTSRVLDIFSLFDWIPRTAAHAAGV